MASEKKATGPTERPVLVTTAHRGVFFGYATATEGNTIKLRAGRLCIYWSADVKGFMGLASSGPSDACRIAASSGGRRARGSK